MELLLLSPENYPDIKFTDTRFTMNRNPSIMGRLLFSGCSFGIFLGVILLVRFLLLDQITEKDLSAESISWPTTQGIVTYSLLDDGGRYSKDHPDITFQYQVEGKTFENNRVSYQTSWLYRDAENFVDNHSVNGPVDVHYRPDDPGVSVLLPGTWDGNGFFIFFAIMMSILVYISLIFLVPGILGLMPMHLVRYYCEQQSKSKMFRQIWLFPLVALVSVILLPFMKINRQN